MFETRWARYSDPRNLDWEFDVDMNHASKWERHAWSAYLDLVATESERDSLLERVRVLEGALKEIRDHPHNVYENTTNVDVTDGHRCAAIIARAALVTKGRS
jgi:Trp operon repressor